MKSADSQHSGGSLRRRMLGAAAVACALSWVAGGLAIYNALHQADAQIFDARLSDIAHTLLAFADHEISEIQAEGGTPPRHIETEGTAQGRYLYQIWSREGRLVLASANAPLDAPLMPLAKLGWDSRLIDGQPHRVFSALASSTLHLIQAAEPVDQRLSGWDIFNRFMAFGLLASALTVALVTVVLLRMALRPLDAAVDEIAQRGPGDLRALAQRGLPVEFRALVSAVNRLMQRLDVALRSEREFVAAAAHELRTPLAGLRAQAQVAAHTGTSEMDRGQALQQVQIGVDHAAHLVSQLLDLARSDALAGDPVRVSADSGPVDIRAVLAPVMGELGPAAAERGLSFVHRVELPTLWGSELALGLILRNLLANAVAHASAGGQVAIGTRVEGQRAVLWVADSGPGIAPHERERVLERFHRGTNPTTPGCGLGLSIVKSLCEAHEAELRLGESAWGGLLVEIWFPPRDAA
jgi:signal transduction histidine kinase